MSSIRQVLAACFLASCIMTVAVATEASERQSESVEVTFYQLSTSEWNSVQSTFKSLVATEAKSYCSGSNAATCGLASGDQFTASEVGVASGPTEESKSLKISFYIDYPVIHTTTSSATLTYVVNSASVKAILTNIRQSLEDAVGADITYIDDEFYSIDPATTLNKVLIPIAFIVLLAVIILAVALHMWNKRKEQAEKKKQRALDREKRKKTSRITPVFTVDNETNDKNWPQRSRKKKRPQEAAYQSRAQPSNGSVATLSLKTNMLTYDSNNATTQSEEPVPLRTKALPPLPMSEEETQEERKKEKKEKKRKKRQRSANANAEGQDESASLYSKTESLEKTGGAENVVPVEDELQVVA